MFQPDNFQVVETLHDGSTVEIRAQKPEDKEAILEAVRTPALTRSIIASSP